MATYKDENGTTTVEGKNLVTSDLINAFSKLNPHAALLTEQKEVDGIESVDEVPDIIGQVLDVTGYSIGGDGDNEGGYSGSQTFSQNRKSSEPMRSVHHVQ